MKTRESLVSNSSSTSFIIAYRVSEPCKCCGRKDLDIIDKIHNLNCYDDRNEVFQVGIGDIIKNVLTWDFDSDRKEEILKKLDDFARSENMEKMNIFHGSISDHEYEFKESIYNMIAHDGAIMIYNKGED